jgi:hypothetical protein
MNNEQYEGVLACLEQRIKKEAKNSNKLYKYQLCCGRLFWFKKWITPDAFFGTTDEAAILYFQTLLLKNYKWTDGSPVNLLRYSIKFPLPSDSSEDLCESFLWSCGLGDSGNWIFDCALWIEKSKKIKKKKKKK